MVGSDNRGSKSRHMDINRRSILSLTGAGMAAALAGCLGGDDDLGEIATSADAHEGQTIGGLLKEGYESDVIVDHISDFEESTGTTVELERYTEEEAHQNFVLAANNDSDAYAFNTVQHWYYPQMDQNDWLTPMDELLQNHRADWVDIAYDGLFDSVKQPFETDGNPHAIPHSLISGMFYYREDVFDELGLDEPETTADVLQASEEIADSDLDIVPNVGRTASTFDSFGTWAGWAWGYGARVLNDNGEVTVDTPEMHEAVEDYVTLMRDYGPEGAASIQWTDLPSYILSGDVAMLFGTTGWGGVFHEERDDIAETLITGPADNYTQWLYAEGLGIPSWISDGSRSAAWQLTQWRMSEDVLLHEIETQNRFDIPHQGIMESDEYQQLAVERDMTDHVEVLQESFEVLNDEYWPYVPEFAEIGNAFMQEMSNAIDEQQTPAEAVENAHANIEEILE